ncbi:MAG: hypothetical protein NZ960_03075 [Candidatus Kapabacteria bacterium]|nr:hypothetical protein [Candidatus Kapabacteria bacterium]MDW8012357.1 DUF6580 family putative transport protein [Bacteroidota bacterium]
MKSQRDGRWKQTSIALGLIVLAALSRLLPHPPNFTPMMAIALFGGTVLSSGWAYGIPLGAMALSDIALGFLNRDWTITFHPTLPVVYGCFAIGVALAQGFLRLKFRLSRLVAVVFASSFIFFIVTNFAVWLLTDWYPKTIEGLVACYVAALPFYRNSLMADIVYSGLLFGAYFSAARLFGYVPVPGWGHLSQGFTRLLPGDDESEHVRRQQQL